MARQLTGSKKISNGDITGLAWSGWSHTKSETVRNIQADSGSYFVCVGGRQVSPAGCGWTR